MDCKAELYIADDYGDNHATMTCGLPEGHEGPHQEVYAQSKPYGPVTVTWHGKAKAAP